MSTYKSRAAKKRNHRNALSNTDHKIRVFGYCRVSTDIQAQHGLSLEAQHEEIKRLAAEKGWFLEEMFVDSGFSAKNTERPAFQRMARAIQNSDGAIAAVLVTKLDRLTRSLRDLCNINEDLLDPFGCNLVAIRDGINTFEPMSKMILPFLAILGQIERQTTGERVKATIQHIRQQGGHYGKVPFGHKMISDGKIKRLVPDETTYPWLQKAIGWYHENVNMSEIAKRLNHANIKPRYGKVKEWTENKIYELFRTLKVHKPRSIQSDARYDKREAYKLAYTLRTDGKTLVAIAESLNQAGLRPLKSDKYRWHSVQ